MERKERGEEGEGEGREEKKPYFPAVTVYLGLLALSVVQETGWHQGPQRDRCSGRRSLCQNLRTLCQDTVSCIKLYCLVEFLVGVA